MSRAAGGAYTLPAGNPVITGTIITSTWGNTTMSDIATTLTDSLSRSGLGGMTAPLLGTDGAVATPAYSFTNEPSSGIYRIGASNLGVSIAGTKRIDLGAAALSTVGLNVSLGVPASGTTLALTSINASNSLSMSDGTETLYWVTDASHNWRQGVNGSHNLTFFTANTDRLAINSAGTVTINSPSSGVPLTVNNTTAATIGAVITSTQSQSAASPSLSLASTAANGFCTLSLGGNNAGNPVAGTNDLSLFINGTTSAGSLLNRANASLNLGANALTYFVIAATGGSTAGPPASGTALTVTGVAAAAALVVNGSASTPGFSIGNSSTAFTLDCSKSNVQYVTMNGNVAAGSLTISNIQDGQSINLLLTQDATGTRTLGNPTGVKWPGGTVGVLSTAASSVDMITFTRINAVTYATILKAFA